MSCLSEREISDHLAGAASAEDRQRVRSHIDGCASCRAVVAAGASEVSRSELRPHTERPGPAEPLPPEWEHGAKLGRYLLLERLGAGGRGVVFAAYHPDLDRKVAIKRVRAAPGRHSAQEAGQLLLREARAMARLAHPNVLSVFDAFSAEDDEVFIVMELLEGANLAQWLEEGGHPAAEILAVLLAAGRGLQAAHEAGITHNDFKPSNVLLGPQGRTCVSDFGLSSLVPLSPLAPEGARAEPVKPETGGTPAYMAPEQWEEGRTSDARADQYAFCLTAWDALLGQRPQGAPPISARFPPPVEGVAAHVRQALERGLQTDPAARHPSMAALLAALERNPARARRRAALVAAAVVGTVGLAAYVQLERGWEQRRCAQSVAQVDVLWGQAAKQRIGGRLRGVGKGYAADIWRSVEQRLDHQTGLWRQLRQDACHARSSIRSACLDQWLTQLRTLTELYGEADAATLDNALPAAWAMQRVESCADPASMLVNEAAAGSRLADWTALRARLGVALTLLNLHREKEALAGFHSLGPELAAFGSPSLSSEYQLLLGQANYQLGDHAAAIQSYEAGVELALAGGRDDLAIRGMIQLIAARARQAGGKADTDRWTRLATALLARQPSANGSLRAALLYSVSLGMMTEGRWAEARKGLEEGLRLVREGPDRDPFLEGKYLRSLSNVLRSTGKTDEARVLIKQYLDSQLALLGPSHPRVADALNGAGAVESSAGNYEAGLEFDRRAMEIVVAAYGETHPNVATGCFNLALSLMWLKRPEEALGYARRSFTILSAKEPDHVDLPDMHGLIAAILLELGRVDEAERELRQARERVVRGGREQTVHAAQLHLTEAHARLARCDAAGARALLKRSVEILEKLYGPQARQLGDVLTELGELELREKNLPEALRWLERAALARKDEQVRFDVARTQFALARALSLSGAPAQERARALAQDALSRYGAVPVFESERQALQRWLADGTAPPAHKSQAHCARR